MTRRCFEYYMMIRAKCVCIDATVNEEAGCR